MDNIVEKIVAVMLAGLIHPDDLAETNIAELKKSITAIIKAADACGYALVPKVATQVMIDAGVVDDNDPPRFR